jgi:hypothetical protein
MPPEWLPSPRGDKAMSDYNAGWKKTALAATKICLTTKRSSRQIKVCNQKKILHFTPQAGFFII